MFRSILVAALASAGAQAQALTLDFGNGPARPSICTENADGSGSLVECTAGKYLSQTYGDVAGVTDISYVAPRFGGSTLKWWDTLYNNLYGVAYAQGGDTNSLARIEIKALQPNTVVTLGSFDLGAYNQTTLNTTVNVYAIGGGAPLFTFTGAVGNGTASATTFTPGISVAGGLWIEWADTAFNVGIDNIQYSVSTVPEPASGALLLSGMLGLAVRRLRRQS